MNFFLPLFTSNMNYSPDDVIADIVEYLKEPMDDYDDDSLMNQFLKFNNRTDSNLY